ncbi:glycosyltransferase family 2 protein [Paracoccus nototheniae]|uniref:Glycosyltransferase family 2 protein n=1 Tax=Paracoccus nototheniae TaxID=2489002 RepID=A0ABW4DXB0_9RHOB|nr:glycosyltransferase [Paracoccus nototheniae]
MSAVSEPNISSSKVAAVVIGRNEGARLQACLTALSAQIDRIVYVDSGSTDGSADFAAGIGAQVVALDMTLPFTAARARNAGLTALADAPPEFVQFLDGDCVLQPGWLPAALTALQGDAGLAVVAGRRREMFPERSVYNRLCDAEWDTPVGPARAVGGDMLVRHAAIDAIGGFDPTLIAGEEPEMCVRLRAAGWTIRRLPVEMTLHDADMTRLPQWWKRTRRAGHAFAEGAALHGAPPEGHWRAETRRALIWGAGLPLLAILGALLWDPLALAILLVYPVQILRLSRRMGWLRAGFSVLGKFAEAQGALGFYRDRLTRRRAALIEYK